MVSDAQQLFVQRMNVLYPGMPLFFENVDMKDETGYYAVFHVIAGDTLPINLGITAKSRNVGIIQIDIIGPVDVGRGEAFNRAFQAGKIFRRQVRTIGGEGQVTYKDPSGTNVGQVRGKHMEMTRIPYRYDFVG
jgi:hypothetical protein